MKRELLIGIYYNTIGRLFEGAKYYKLDLSKFNNTEEYQSFGDFKFFMPTWNDLALFEKLYELKPDRIKDVEERFASGKYICFAYLEIITGRLAYTRWICLNEFYSSAMRKTFKYSGQEAITLDSYTHPDYRNLGLHRKMNIAMLTWLKANTSIRSVYMVILMFIPYLTKIPIALGYKPIECTFYYKKGSIKKLFKK